MFVPGVEIYNFSELITRENHFYAVGQLFVCMAKYVFTSCCFNSLPPVAGIALHENVISCSPAVTATLFIGLRVHLYGFARIRSGKLHKSLSQSARLALYISRHAQILPLDVSRNERKKKKKTRTSKTTCSFVPYLINSRFYQFDQFSRKL